MKKFVPRQTPDQAQRERHAMDMFAIPQDLADATPFEPPPDWPAILDEIQREVQISVSSDRLWRLVRHFALDSFTESNRSSAKAARLQLEELRAVADRLNTLLVELENENSASLLVLLSENAPERVSIDALRGKLSSLVAGCFAVLDNFDFYTVGKPGRSPLPGFRRFISALAKLFEEAEGRPRQPTQKTTQLTPGDGHHS